MKRRYYSGRDVRRAVTVEEVRRMAARRTPNFIFEYVEGGSEDEISLRRNRDVFERIAWLPQTLSGAKLPDLTTELLGETLRMPIVIAPTGFNGMLWPEGDRCLGRAAAEAGIPFTLSTVANYDVVKLANELPGKVWFQLYPLKDQKTSDRLIERAAEAGCDKLVVTTDVPVLGAREWDQRSYRKPLKLGLRSMLDVLAHPDWLRRVMIPHGAPKFANLSEFLPRGNQSAMQGALFMNTQINPMLDWSDIARFRKLWKGKLILKGILRLDDARRAVEAGADGIVLSNHGGRQLDSAVSGLEVLPSVAAELAGKVAILVDGGFRRGSDVVKALALGADGVMIGRTTLYGLGAGGEAGVAHVLGLLRNEMQRTLELLGCRDLDELGPHLIRS
jgi:(S)-mandelate dehydrogenase